MASKLFHLGLLVVLLAGLVGCTPPRQPLTPAPAPNATPLPSPTPAPIATLAPSATPLPSKTPVSTQGWLTYQHSVYGFTLSYPPTWTAAEDLRPASTSYKHALWLQPKADALTRLVIGFKRGGEGAGIARTGLGQGELVERGGLSFLGQELTVRALVDRGQDRTILYGSGEIQRGGMLFTLYLDYLGDPAQVAGLSEVDEAIAAKIIASVALK